MTPKAADAQGFAALFTVVSCQEPEQISGAL
jgi:hypothetical protein